jgi:DeoR family transcriptional regulator, fructose operon transcriptional repressor
LQEKMLKEERKEYIQNIIAQRGSASIKDLAKEFNVSYSTIRRDLNILDKKEILKRIHGGAISDNIQKAERELNVKMDVNVGEKKAIAFEAVKQINDGDIIFIEMATSTLYLCELLSRFRHITVITNGCEIAHSIVRVNPTAEVYLTGGYFKKDTHVLMGQLTDYATKSFNFGKAFVGITALDIDKGMTSVDYMEAQTKKTIISSANIVIGLADNSKFGSVCIHSVGPISDLDLIITDDKTEASYLNKIKKYKTKVIIAHL